MTRRFFWQLKGRVKFRTVFESADTVYGVNGKNEHRLFRKDTGLISFTDPAARRKRARVRLSERQPVVRIVRLVPRLIPLPV